MGTGCLRRPRPPQVLLRSIRPSVRRQAGAALLAALLLMLALLMLGVSAAHTALAGAKSARNERERQIAFAAAEAALADAERDIDGGANPSSARAMAFAGGDASVFAAGCADAGSGLCRHVAPPAAPAWQSADLAGDPACCAAYGAYTGASMPAGVGLLPAAAPRYIVELLPQPAGGGHLYRITALGVGSHGRTRVVLQSYYRKAAVPGQPGQRSGWREIANWQELHQAAIEAK
jgi:Tfp pilus assembly protein PilX